jgi:hypothetical protein
MVVFWTIGHRSWSRMCSSGGRRRSTMCNVIRERERQQRNSGDSKSHRECDGELIEAGHCQNRRQARRRTLAIDQKGIVNRWWLWMIGFDYFGWDAPIIEAELWDGTTGFQVASIDGEKIRPELGFAVALDKSELGRREIGLGLPDSGRRLLRGTEGGGADLGARWAMGRLHRAASLIWRWMTMVSP